MPTTSMPTTCSDAFEAFRTNKLTLEALEDINLDFREAIFDFLEALVVNSRVIDLDFFQRVGQVLHDRVRDARAAGQINCKQA